MLQKLAGVAFEGQRAQRRVPQGRQLAQRGNTVFRQAQVLDLRNLWQLTHGRQMVPMKIKDFTSVKRKIDLIYNLNLYVSFAQKLG